MSGDAVMMDAVAKGDIAAVQRLLAQMRGGSTDGDRLGSENNNNNVAKMVSSGNFDRLKSLLEADANPDATGEDVCPYFTSKHTCILLLLLHLLLLLIFSISSTDVLRRQYMILLTLWNILGKDSSPLQCYVR
mmetsp:Transcript_39069/g.63583  ORF Transcript_39069/g.63583 Transcript_39069/m.63583 type:complete len:133 (+) Transcript_39069:88-486(+)